MRSQSETITLASGDVMPNLLMRTRPPILRSIPAVYLLTAILGFAGGPLTADAADLPVKAPGAPAYQWTGCYGGFNVGAGASGSDFGSTVDPGTHLVGDDPGLVSGDGSGSANVVAFLGGGQAGCNFQTGTVVVGLEGDFDYFHSKPQFSNDTNTLSDGTTPFTVTQSLTTEYLATVRPRLGIAADRNLAYITGGAAFTRASYSESYVDGAAPAGAGLATISKSLVGWAAGAGWEYALAEHWTFRAEYLFARFATSNGLGAITDAGGGANALHGSADLTIQLLRAGLNFKF